MQRMFSWTTLPLPASDQYLQGPAYFFSAILAVLLAGAVIWLLLRARPLFEPKRQMS